MALILDVLDHENAAPSPGQPFAKSRGNDAVLKRSRPPLPPV
jgi:hypothetical protein